MLKFRAGIGSINQSISPSNRYSNASIKQSIKDKLTDTGTTVSMYNINTCYLMQTLSHPNKHSHTHSGIRKLFALGGAGFDRVGST